MKKSSVENDKVVTMTTNATTDVSNDNTSNNNTAATSPATGKAAASHNNKNNKRRPRSTPRETPQMNVLDHDGRDFVVDKVVKQKEETPKSPSSPSRTTTTKTKTNNNPTTTHKSPPSVKSWRPPTPPPSSSPEPSQTKYYNSDDQHTPKSSSKWWSRWTTTRSSSSPSLSTMSDTGISTAIPTATDFAEILASSSSPTKEDTIDAHSSKKTTKHHHKHIKNKKLLEPLQQQQLSLEDNDESTNNNNNETTDSSNTTTNTNPTREDQLRQNCSFFYRDMDDDHHGGGADDDTMEAGTRTINQHEQFEDETLGQDQDHYRTRRHQQHARNLFRNTQNRLARKFRRRSGGDTGAYARMNGLTTRNNNTRHVDESHAVVIQTDSPSHVSFCTRFDELNALVPESEVARRNRHEGDPNNDHEEEDLDDIHFDLELQLETGGGEGCDSEVPRVANFAQSSSLSYYHDGKVLMRLPQDNVRLLVDPSLAPGILSVERKSSLRKPKKQLPDEIPNNNTNHTNKWKEELTYVLTVDEDVYKGLLAEIVKAERAPCGLYYCGQEADHNNHVHIGVAVFIMTIVLIVLFVNTVIYPF